MDVLEVRLGIFQLCISKKTNVVIINRDELVLIDTGYRSGTGDIRDFLRSLGRSPEEIRLIILTHNHIDHVGGLPSLRKFTGARVALHKADLDAYPALPRLFHFVATAPFTSHFRSRFYVAPEEVDLPLRGGEVLPVLGGLAVIETPGHTPGSISLYAAKEKLLFVGDALSKYGENIDLPVRRYCQDEAAARASVRKLAGLDFDTVCFGHGKPLNGSVREKIRCLSGL